MAGKRFVLITVEQLRRGKIASTTEDSAVRTVALFIQQEIIIQFVPPRRIVSYNGADFMAVSAQNFMRRKGVYWKVVLAYVPVIDGTDRMVGTIQNAIEKSTLENEEAWAKVFPQVLYGYRRRDRCPSPSLFRMMYYTNPRMLASDVVALLTDAGHHQRLL